MHRSKRAYLHIRIWEPAFMKSFPSTDQKTLSSSFTPTFLSLLGSSNAGLVHLKWGQGRKGGLLLRGLVGRRTLTSPVSTQETLEAAATGRLVLHTHSERRVMHAELEP